jgi:hypothetical protein
MEISIQSGDEVEQLRTRLRKMTDSQLVSFGKAARSLCRDPKCPEVFKRQLEEAKTEWRRRHPKALWLSVPGATPRRGVYRGRGERDGPKYFVNERAKVKAGSVSMQAVT